MSTATAYVQDEFYEGLLADFLDESSQLLDRLNEDLLVLDEWAAANQSQAPSRCDDELMNSMFRSAHSIKGLAAMLGLQNIKHLTHRVENVFDAARKDKLTLDCDAVQVVFRSVDLLVEMIESLRESGSDDIAADEVITSIQQVLRAADVHSEPTNQSDADEVLNRGRLAETQGESAAATSPPKESCGMTFSPNNSPGHEEVEVVSTPVPLVDYFADITDESGIPPKYLAIFIDETEQSLDSLTETLLNVETENNDETTQTLLIISHRIKGSAASVGLNRPAKLSHLMEDILQELRESGDHPTSDMVDAMLKCTDALRHYVVGLKSGEAESAAFNELAHILLAANQRTDEKDASQQSSDDSNTTDDCDDVANNSDVVLGRSTPPDEDGFDEALLDSLRKLTDGESAALAGRVHFQRDLPLAGLKGRLVYEKLSHLGAVFFCDPESDGLDEMESLSSLTFGLKSDASHEAIHATLQVVGVDRVEIVPLSKGMQKPQSAAESAAPPAKPEATTTIARAVGANTPKVTQLSGAAASRSSGKESIAKPNETLRVDTERLDQLMNLAGQLVINKARFTQISEGLRESMLSKQTPQLIANVGVLADNILSHTEAADGKQSSLPDMEAVRSHARRLQSDLAVVGREINRLTDLRNGVNELFEAVHQLDRASSGIQQSVMDMRMVPIGPLFGRFRRVIRDITRSNGKEIRLVIRGEKTELDKRMIDELGDPLIHMVRNSADHGIESPEQREATGKPRQGTVTLDAFHRGNSIFVQIHDDGKGLDKDKIVAKALEKNFISRTDIENMDAHQLYQLIWEPGLTTADKVTEVSGRGMGMDIVRSKIEELNGSVDVDSESGVGTTFTIKLPLTLAILPSLMAVIDEDVFALPVESVVEIVTISKSELATVHGLTTATIRGRVVSVVGLDHIFTWHEDNDRPAKSASTDCTLVIIGSEGQELGLRVDALLGEEDVVIKSMADNYRNVFGVAGASILGNGRVSLILDVNALIEMSSRAAAAAHHE